MGLDFVAATVEGGGYLSAFKAIPVLVILLIWCRGLTFVDKDTIEARLPRIPFNIGLLGGLILSFALFLFLPNFLIALTIFILGFGIEIGVYLFIRNQKVGLKDLKSDFNDWLKSLRGQEKSVKEIAGAVQLVGPNGALVPAPPEESPEAESYNGMQKMLTDPLENGAEIIEFAPGEGSMAVKYSVDGVIYNGAKVSKTTGQAALSYLKAASGLDLNEARKPQSGTLKLNIHGKKRELKFTTKGSTAGEFGRLISDPKRRHDFTVDTLGMFPDQVELVRSGMKSEGGGITLLSAPKGQGLTSLSYAVLRSHDAFLEHILTVERDQEQDLEGVTQSAISSGATAAEETKQIGWVISQQPDILLVSKPESQQSAVELIKSAKEGRRIYITLLAGSTAEAVTAWRKLVGDDKLAMSQLKMVISGRTVRKLCVACKQGYTPDPNTLRKLNMDPEKVDQLFQARKEPPRDPKGNPIRCEFCNDLRYKGRTGIFEILMITDEVRQILLAGGAPAQLKSAFRKQHGAYLQEIGLQLVEKGETSVQEVLRVLKTGKEGSSSSSSKSSRKPADPVANEAE